MDSVVDATNQVFDKMEGLKKQADAVGVAMSTKMGAAADILQRSMRDGLAPAMDFAFKRMVVMIAKQQDWTREQRNSAAALFTVTGRLAEMEASLASVADGMGRWAKTLAMSVGAVTGPIVAFATAGLHASVYGEQLRFRMQQLSLTIAGIFRPEIERLIDIVGRVTQWLRSLSQEQLTSIARWTIGAIAAAAVAGVLATVVSAIGAAVGAFKMLTYWVGAARAVSMTFAGGILVITAALVALALATDETWVKIAAAVGVFLTVITIGPAVVRTIGTIVTALRAMVVQLVLTNALSGPAGWIKLAAGIGIAAGALAGLNYGAGKLGDFMKGIRSPVAPNMGGFSSPEQAYEKVAAASAMMGKSVPEQQLDEQKAGNMTLQQIKSLLANQKPALAMG